MTIINILPDIYLYSTSQILSQSSTMVNHRLGPQLKPSISTLNQINKNILSPSLGSPEGNLTESLKTPLAGQNSITYLQVEK